MNFKCSNKPPNTSTGNTLGKTAGSVRYFFADAVRVRPDFKSIQKSCAAVKDTVAEMKRILKKIDGQK